MTARIPNAVMAKGLLVAVLAGFVAPCRALDLAGEDAGKLAFYEAGLAEGDPALAAGFIADPAFADRLRFASPEKAAALLSKAQALNGLAALLDKPWRDEQEAELSQALSIMIDLDKPLSLAGVGPLPETLLAWMDKYGNYAARGSGAARAYSAHKRDLVRRAIRSFEAVFPAGSAEGRRKWEAATIRERNAFLANKADRELQQLIAVEPRTDKALRDEVLKGKIFRYLDAAGRARYERYLTQLAAAEAAKTEFSVPQLSKLNGRPIEQQMYILGRLFDKNRGSGGVSLERKVDGARRSRPGETLSYQENLLLAGMLRAVLPAEAKGTASGDRVVQFYASAGGPDVAIESCGGCYAKYEPAAGRIVLDPEMIQQYMRVNGLSTAALLKDKGRVAALAKYVSPIFVHEATHQMQHAWADRAGVFKPYVQEDEVEAGSVEALYTLEKLKNDPGFRALFSKMRASSVYADQRLKLAQRFSRSPDDFGDAVRRLYYYGLPSFESASSQVLEAVSAELTRRASLDAAALAELEGAGVDLAAVRAMTASGLVDSVREIGTPALRKVQDDFLSKAVYAGHYESAADWAISTLAATRGARSPRPGPVPAL